MSVAAWVRSRIAHHRRRKILSRCDLTGTGLEIGGSFQPVVPRSSGARVKTLDHLDQESLRLKYRGLPGIDVGKIEQVDFVWDGRTYSDIVRGERFSWIVASHVIEHVPDMVGFLKDCSSVLDHGGVLALAVPDMRFTMDKDRPESGLAQAIDAHLRRDVRPSVGALTELHVRAVGKRGRINWRPFHVGPTYRLNQASTFRETYQAYLKSEGYIDDHVWCHTPGSFRRLLRELHEIGEVDLELIRVEAAWGLEFYAWLRKP